MKKRTALLATMMVTLGAAFLHCETVEAGIFKPQELEPYGFYTISPDCVYNDATNNDYINSVYFVGIAQAGDDIELLLLDTVSNYTEEYTLYKADKSNYYYNYDEFIFIEYFEDYGKWFLEMDDTCTCLDQITWEYSYMPYIDNNEYAWMNPMGYYYDDEDSKLLFTMYDLYDTGYYAASYVDSDGDVYRTLVDIEYEDESMMYTIGDLGTAVVDDTFCEFYFSNEDDGIVTTLTKILPYDYEHIDVYDYTYFDAVCTVGDEYYATIHIDFNYVEDDYGRQLKYTMTSEFWDEEITGYAITTYGSVIVSNDFCILSDNDGNCEIFVPKVLPYWLECDYTIS